MPTTPAKLESWVRSKAREKQRGRPTLFREDMIGQAERMAALGMGVAQMAAVWGRPERTVWRWARRYPSFRQALQKGRESGHMAVAGNLYAAASGRALKEELVSPALGPDGQVVLDPSGKPLFRTRRVYQAANLGAMVFYLCNRQPDLWQNVQRVEVKRTGDELRPLMVQVQTRDGQMQAIALSDLDKPLLEKMLGPKGSPMLPGPDDNGKDNGGAGRTRRKRGRKPDPGKNGP